MGTRLTGMDKPRKWPGYALATGLVLFGIVQECAGSDDTSPQRGADTPTTTIDPLQKVPNPNTPDSPYNLLAVAGGLGFIAASAWAAHKLRPYLLGISTESTANNSRDQSADAAGRTYDNPDLKLLPPPEES